MGMLSRTINTLPRCTLTPHLLAIGVIALLCSGCASMPGRTVSNDPYEGVNRGIFKFNDAVDRAALKPVAKGYKKVVPQVVRTGIGNVLTNLSYPATVVNQFLQGKAREGFKDTGRLLLNSTVGIAGLFDVATSIGLAAHDEDFGQTLAVWGVNSGPYVTLPFFGPSSVRDAPARVFDFFLSPLDYADVPWEVTWGVRGIDAVHTRAELLIADPTLERTFDPYAFLRDAWSQKREFEIFDGEPPPPELEEELIEEDAEPSPTGSQDPPPADDP